MTHRRHVIAVDLGAESGRVAKVFFDGSTLQLEEAHRFPNIPVQTRGVLNWDPLRLWHEITTGIELAKGASGIGVDTWGVDFAFLDREGRLLANPLHYRQERAPGIMDWVFERVPRREVFDRTGIQFMVINGVYLLATMAQAKSSLFDAAGTILTIPDLFNYWLTGERSCEFTHATTTQAYNPRRDDWDRDTLSAIDVPLDIFPKVNKPGTRLGDYQGIPVILPATHDTGSAVVAVPTTTENYAYLSSGTWSLLGLEVDEPIINDQAYAYNVTNEGGVYGNFRLLKNVMGLWLAQQCRATWTQAGTEYSYEQLKQLANQAEPFRSLVDPNDPIFLPPGDMPGRIRDFCRSTGQLVPETPGQVMRAVYESLALRYRAVLDQLIDLTGRQVDVLHIIGGGVRNELLCQMTADAIGRDVVAGPAEATAIGNAIIQYISLGEIGSVAQAREIMLRSSETIRYQPQNAAHWGETYQRFKGLMTTV